ncbi:MAG: hypothetical protein AAGB26_09170 [Planctomycetota bacterium]
MSVLQNPGLNSMTTRVLLASSLLLALSTYDTDAAIIVTGDFVSGPTGSPPASADPTFWTGGGDPNSDPNALPNTDGIVGVTSDGLLTVSGGSILNLFHLDLGQQPGATGTVEVTGAGSTLNLGRHFHIGAHADDASTLDGGNGMLSITDGGLVDVVSDIWLGDSAASTGTAIIDGVGSILRTGDDLFIGDDGMGSLTVRNGGIVEAADEIKVGDDTGGNGALMVDGPGSVIRAIGRDFDIGDDGVGQAKVINGGRLEAGDDIQIANDTGSPGSSLTVQGAGSIIVAADQIRVGDEDEGSLTLSAGARAEAESVVVGGNEAGIGHMIVEGIGTTAVANGSDFISGGSGRGIVTIRDGGRVEAAVVRLGDGDTGDGVIDVQGNNSIIVSNDSYLVGFGGSGRLVVSDGARAEAAGDFFLGLDPGGVGFVTVQGAGTTLETTGGSINMGPQGGNGRLSVLDGARVTAFADVGIATVDTSDSWVTVRGSNSELSSASITVGGDGKGVLNVLNGGRAMASIQINLGESLSGVGVVNIRGGGSQISANILNVGIDGSGTFNLSESGSASFETAGVSATSTVNMVVSGDNMLAATTSYTNEGTTNFIAGSQLASGSYVPINSPVFSGSGGYVGIGGTTSFPSGVPTFTVGSIIADAGDDGTESMIDGGDRVQIGRVTISLNENAGTNGTLTVTDLNLLEIFGNEVLSALSIQATGLNSALLHALSFDVGLQDRDALTVLQRPTGAGDDNWVAFDPTITDFTNGTFTFTIDQLSGFDYAVAIPEPASLTFLALGGLAMTRRRR